MSQPTLDRQLTEQQAQALAKAYQRILEWRRCRLAEQANEARAEAQDDTAGRDA